MKKPSLALVKDLPKIQQWQQASHNWLQNQWQALRHMNADDLDLHSAGQWPDVVKVLSWVLIFSLTFFAAHWFLISKSHALLQQQQQEQQRLMDRYRFNAFQAAHLPAYQQQMVEIEHRLEHLLQQFSSVSEVPRLLEDIQRQADEQTLEWISLALRPEVRGAFYTELPFEIRARGHYHQLGAFIEGISQLDRMISLHDFQLTPSQQSASLLLVMQAKAYRYDAPEASLPASSGGIR